MIILNTSIKKGTTVQLNINIAKLHTRTTVEMPIIVSRGKEDGPCLLIMGGIHGDEVNGVEIVRQLVSKNYHIPERGTIITIPLVNVFGFLNLSREFPDGRDLNRVFPGSKTGSLASRFAYSLIKDIIPHVDYCIDYHTGGAQRFNAPQIRIAPDKKINLDFAKVLNADFIVYAKNRPKTLRASLDKRGITYLLFEGGKSLDFDDYISTTGVQAAINLMHYLKLRDYSDLENYSSESKSIIINKSSWDRAKYSGMLRTKVKIGQKVKKKQILGSISDPFGEFEKNILSTMEGYILNVNQAPLVNQGDALFNIGLI